MDHPPPSLNGPALDAASAARFRDFLGRRRQQISARLGASAEVRAPVLADVDQALRRIEGGEFGRCDQCGQGVEKERLELDFTTCVCLDHYSREQLRELESDLELAAKVQRDLLPVRAPEVAGWEIAAFAQPARIVSGDHYDFFPLRDGRLGLAIADVMGKGVAAALLVANLQATLRALGPQHDDVGELAGRVNELLCFNLNMISFVSLFLAEIDPRSAEMRWCNAGHEPPLWREARSGSLAPLEATGPAIGLVPRARYAARTAHLQQGDALICYTDGLTESRDPQGRLFGLEQMTALLGAETADAKGLVRALRRGLTAFTRGAEPRDDLTLVAVRRR